MDGAISLLPLVEVEKLVEVERVDATERRDRKEELDDPVYDEAIELRSVGVSPMDWIRS